MNKFDVNSLLREAEKMQKEIASKQAELENVTVEGTAGGGSVRITATGNGKIRSVKIAPDAVAAGDTQMLEDMVLSAIHSAMAEADKLSEELIAKTTGGKLPFKKPGR